MSKKERLKEIINTLRGVFAITMALIVTVTSGLISRSDQKLIDVYFFLGVLLDILLILSTVIIFRRIIKRTNELEDL